MLVMMDATVTNGQLATHLSDLLKDEKVDNDVVIRCLNCFRMLLRERLRK